MVEIEKIVEADEFTQIMHHIRNGDNFLLSGGAGSGKTYTLVQVIKQIIDENPTEIIACMTYTNAAVKEIEERVNHKNLNVTTIHDFLWDNIKHFQKELKLSLIELINDTEQTKITTNKELPITNDFFIDLDIQYKEYLRISEGIISHDEILILANYLFSKYPKINSILKDKFKYILIDEYQDTNEKVIEIFLEHFNKSDKKNVVGFFGDAMQSIYDDSIGNLDDYKDGENGIKEVIKIQNRRNPQSIIDLANKLRTDGLAQLPSTDLNAPNMNRDGSVKNGSIKFVFSSISDMEKVRNYLGWNFSNTEETKELNLTHNLIASKAGIRSLMDIYNNDGILKYKSRIKKHIKDNNILDDFSEKTFGEVIEILNTVRPTPAMNRFIVANQELYNEALNYNWEIFSKIYVDKDQLLDSKKQNPNEINKKGSKRDSLIRHLYKIQTNIFLYQEKRYNEFLRLTDYRFNLRSIKQKRLLKTYIEDLINVGNKTIEEIIEEADENGICLKNDDGLVRFMNEKEYVFNRVKQIQFKEFQKLYDYLEGFTPFSTQHKTKGTEFDNVLVALDNGNWNKYNFEYLFLDNGSASVLERTQKLFYVCCTRAKENLAVYFVSPSNSVIDKAIEWFGEGNVIDLDSL